MKHSYLKKTGHSNFPKTVEWKSGQIIKIKDILVQHGYLAILPLSLLEFNYN